MQLSLKDDINSLSYFKSHFVKVLKKIKSKKRPFIITQNGKAIGVFMDIDTWENQVKKRYVAGAVGSGTDGRAAPPTAIMPIRAANIRHSVFVW